MHEVVCMSMTFFSKAVIRSLVLFAALYSLHPEMKAQEPSPKSTEVARAKPVESDAIFPAVVAKVNGEEIPGRDLENLVRNELASIGSPDWNKLRGEYRGELTLTNITTLINSKLLYQKAAASGVKATDEEVQAELQKIAKTFKSEADMDAALASQHRDRASLAKGLSENLITSKYVDATIKKDAIVTQEEVEKYYKDNHEEFRHPEIVRTSQILIAPEGNSQEQDVKARKRAENLLDRINKGEDFAKLAKENSADGSASRGGDVGFISEGSVTPEYSDAAFSLPVGSVKIVQSQYGYHILKVTDKKGEGYFTFQDVKDQLTEYLKNKKYQEELDNLVAQLREKANIEILISVNDLLNP
jgi:parvulin-like peptidyl-prolyl isomerase